MILQVKQPLPTLLETRSLVVKLLISSSWQFDSGIGWRLARGDERL